MKVQPLIRLLFAAGLALCLLAPWSSALALSCGPLDTPCANAVGTGHQPAQLASAVPIAWGQEALDGETGPASYESGEPDKKKRQVYQAYPGIASSRTTLIVPCFRQRLVRYRSERFGGSLAHRANARGPPVLFASRM